ncbi:DUF2484 family protein [Stagnihabitans tardus]|uniref:DUF2484 family protein n=1 Tax=Stagnihabitans tardus TaxID=2699202 RepID=A0AAE5BRV6_9RHOB|nr:DUF2484 family protein [Stagnihabitans tardus]NBZ87035.1 DUF2484 family protein [Stagnihabitans tardus]
MALILCGVIWVMLATLTALLPMRRQMVPGLVLLASAPVLIAWGFHEAGAVIGLAFLLAFGSMFRRPLIYFTRKALGLPVVDPRRGS